MAKGGHAGPGPRVSGRRLIASAPSLEGGERLDLLIHALAQLPDEVTLELYGEGPDLPRLEVLARAYAMPDRVRFSIGGAAGRGQFVHPSRVNLAGAPVRRPDALVLDVSREAERRPDVVHTMAEFVERLSWPDAPPASVRPDDELFAGERIVVVTNVPAPYRVELFTQVAKRLQAAGACFEVVYQSRAPKRRPWLEPAGEIPFRHHFLRGYELPLGERRAVVPFDLESTLSRLRPTLLVCAGFSPAVAGRAAVFARGRRIPFGIYSGETLAMPTAQQWWRRSARRWIVGQASFAIAYGFESGEYLASLDASLPLVYARNTSLVQRRLDRPQRPDPVRVLSTADLSSDRKGVDILIDALQLVPYLSCELTIVGGGQGLPSLMGQAQRDPRIHFLGPLPYADALSQYGQADIYAFPTRRELYGLVMVEAMGSGLATVASAAPGALGDLAVSRFNCLVVNSHRPSDWAEALERLVRDHDFRRSLGERGRATIARRWTMEHSADAMVAGFRLGLLTRQLGGD